MCTLLWWLIFKSRTFLECSFLESRGALENGKSEESEQFHIFTQLSRPPVPLKARRVFLVDEQKNEGKKKKRT
jgi:hypothetical protein